MFFYLHLFPCSKNIFLPLHSTDNRSSTGSVKVIDEIMKEALPATFSAITKEEAANLEFLVPTASK